MASGFDSIVIGDCSQSHVTVIAKWGAKKAAIVPKTPHLFQPTFAQGASKCVGAYLSSQRGSQRYLQALPFARDDKNYFAGGVCYRGLCALAHHFDMQGAVFSSRAVCILCFSYWLQVRRLLTITSIWCIGLLGTPSWDFGRCLKLRRR